MSRRYRAHGMTLIELMVVVAVGGVILALAVPSMREFMVRQRVKAINAELVNDLQFARSEAITRNTPIWVSFRTDHETITCYTVHTVGTLGDCDCSKPPGTACLGFVEIKTVQVPRSTTVTLHPPTEPASYVQFSASQGMSSWLGHAPSSASYVADWQDFQVTVESSIGAKLRTSTNILGRPQVCTPDGSVSGVMTC